MREGGREVGKEGQTDNEVKLPCLRILDTCLDPSLILAFSWQYLRTSRCRSVKVRVHVPQHVLLLSVLTHLSNFVHHIPVIVGTTGLSSLGKG